MQAKIDFVVGQAMDVALMLGSLAGGLNGTQRLAAGGVATVAVGGLSITMLMISIPVAFMAVLFLPLTLAGGVSKWRAT